ncbi:hypothetical protein [Brevibacillus laterosporus]|uniref:hypothetical protein n=1 Tax=Brevibacillus laterosporus TaxID=1465 RepID=UPI001F558387|nr:hypothetical protein [Brevibacillus laterosporus]MBG9787211.1 hypothetical protein [Brevibacillus laterosporus]
MLADRVNAAASKNQQALTLDQILAEMNKKTPISTYTEATFTTQNQLIENSPKTATTNYKWWDNTINNEMRIETTKDGRTSFYVSKGGMSTSYKEESMEGNKQAVISSTGVKAAVDNKISNANDKQISEYTVTKVDFHPQFNEKDFTLDLPKDVKIIEN